MRRAMLLLAALACLLVPSLAQTHAASATDGTAPPTAVRAAYAKLPLHFERNQGQTDDQVRFLARGPGYTVFLTPTAAVLRLAEGQAQGTADRGRGPQPTATPRQSATVRLQLLGARPSPPSRAGTRSPARSTTSGDATLRSGRPTSPSTPGCSTARSTPAWT